MPMPAKPVLLTGASGALGRTLTRSLSGLGWELRLTDIAPFPDEVPAGARFEKADIADAEAVRRMAEGCGAILHFGGVSVEKPFEEVLGPNIVGLYNVYEAAKAAGARVIFASSNHTVGFRRRDETITPNDSPMPDGYYGASKVWGEMMGRLYWAKHGVESVLVRIGSAFPEPVDERMLATWFSYDDLSRLMERAVLADRTECAIVWGTSDNSRMTWWADDSRDLLGWAPQDSADVFAHKVLGKVSPNPVVERHQGGGYCEMGYSRRS